MALPLVRLGSIVHRETRDIGVAVTPAVHNLADTRSIAGDELPAARIRRALYYRYLLRWRKPAQEVSA